jgi:hypothetical protein
MASFRKDAFLFRARENEVGLQLACGQHDHPGTVLVVQRLSTRNFLRREGDQLRQENENLEPITGQRIGHFTLMLERKRLLWPRGRTADGERNLYEHLRTHQLYEIPAGDLSPEFFVKIQEQLGVLIKGSEKKAGAKEGAPEGG